MGAPRPTRKPAVLFPQAPAPQFGHKSLLRPQVRSRAGSATGFRTAASNARGPRAPTEKNLRWDADGVEDLLNDALDDLIFGAAKTLDELKKMREQASKGINQPKSKGPGSLAGCPTSKSYWNPKADADLWTLSDERALRWSDDGFTGFSDTSGDSEGGESDDDPWDDLAEALGFGGKSQGSSPSGAQTDPASNRNHEEAKRMQGPMGAARSASNPCRPGQRSRPERTFVGPRAAPQQPRQSQQPPTGPAANGSSERAHAGGFQFGNDAHSHQKEKACTSPSAGVAAAAEEAATAAARAAEACMSAMMEGSMAECTLEMQLTASLNAAKAGGPKVLRKVLKRLVLQWHPDKCHDGGEKQKALRTRAFQHLMTEKDRLGL